MGIVILETDLTGNPLGQDAAARGLLADLEADGFDITIVNLDSSEILQRSDKQLLRDLKADSRFAEYKRIIFGRIALDSFVPENDGYSVRVNGNLAMADLQRQVILYRSNLTKTSRASDSQQAISAAFRQLGRSFASELISQQN